MCGLAGFLDPSAAQGVVQLRSVTEAMADGIRHRDPDDGGVWVDERPGIALSHRRLSIIDLSPEGHQPMRSGGGCYVIAYNGEVYNLSALCRELERPGKIDA